MPGLHWLASYPKSGNTWLRTVLRNYVVDGPEPVALDDLGTGAIASARGWIDGVLGFPSADLTPEEIDRLRPDVYRWSAEAGATTGHHKIHDAWRLIDGRPLVDGEATAGAVYVVRNPLDVAPSLASHLSCSVDRAIEHMGDPDYTLSRQGRRMRDQVPQRLGTWSGHVEGWLGSGIPLEVLRYEDMRAEPEAAFARALAFVGLEVEPERLARAVAHSRFERLQAQEAETGFRERPAKASRFFREGRAGGWRETLSDPQVARLVEDHGPVMRRLGYLDETGAPV